jgi:hypothetical protein
VSGYRKNGQKVAKIRYRGAAKETGGLEELTCSRVVLLAQILAEQEKAMR